MAIICLLHYVVFIIASVIALHYYIMINISGTFDTELTITGERFLNQDNETSKTSVVIGKYFETSKTSVVNRHSLVFLIQASIVIDEYF